MVHHENCYGCGACAAACPTDAITLHIGKQGTYSPVVETEKCFGCENCTRVCPYTHTKSSSTAWTAPEYYSVYAAPEVCMKSASGGAFRKMAAFVLRHGGAVFGASYSIASHEVRHCEADMDSLDAICGSKYVQSFVPAAIYRRVKVYLNSGRTVLFSGTPCQIAGLQNFLGKPYDTLLTADIICHGISSVLIWKKFLAEHTIPENIVAVNFRCKKHQQSAMEGYRLEIQYKDGQTEELIPEKCAYYKAYFSGNSICETCTRCRFAYGNRVADVTLGDYIPIELAEQKTLNIKGNSLVILNTQKGRTFFQHDLQSDTSMVTRRVSEKNAVSGNYSLYKPAPEPAGAKTFQKDVMHMPLENAIRKNINSKYDILLFSSFYSEKPEHVFRTLALYALLCEIGCKVALTELPMDLHKEKVQYHYRKEPIAKMVYAHCSVLPPIQNHKACLQLSHAAKLFVLADEPIWTYSYDDDWYLFHDADADTPRIAIGLQIAERLQACEDEQREDFYDDLYQFDKIFLSEKKGKEELEEVLETEIGYLTELLFLQPSSYYHSFWQQEQELLTKLTVSYIMEKELQTDFSENMKKWSVSQTVVTDSLFVAALCMADAKPFFVTATASESLVCLLRQYHLENRILTDTIIPDISIEDISAAAEQIQKERYIWKDVLRKTVTEYLK